MERLNCRLGLKCCFAVESSCNGGAISFYWDENLDVRVHSYSERHIDVLIRENLQAPVWRASFIYGEARVDKRDRTWNLLRSIKSRVAESWLVIGDLNEALW
jgi:hypothetical protein